MAGTRTGVSDGGQGSVEAEVNHFFADRCPGRVDKQVCFEQGLNFPQERFARAKFLPGSVFEAFERVAEVDLDEDLWVYLGQSQRGLPSLCRVVAGRGDRSW